MAKTRNQELIKAFGEHIRKLRLERGLTIEKLAAMSDIEYRQVADVELGRTNATISTAYAIARGLDLPFREVMTFDGF